MYLEITIMEMISSDSIFDLAFFEASDDGLDQALTSTNPNYRRSVAMSPDYRLFFNEDEYGRNNSIRIQFGSMASVDTYVRRPMSLV
jgi:hypothetical protein